MNSGSESIVKSMLNLCMEEQKRGSELGNTWFNCSFRTMQAFRTAMNNSEDPSRVFEVCKESSEDYMRACTSYLSDHSSDILKFFDSVDLVQNKKKEQERRQR